MVGKVFRTLVALLIGAATKEHAMHSEPDSISANGDIKISVIYDNNPYKEGLETAWGFSCLIKGTEKTILFDTGGDGSLKWVLDSIYPLSAFMPEISFLSRDMLYG
jgi:hypothetical protein